MVQYELVKITISNSGIVKIIFEMVVWHHDLPDLIIIDQEFIFTLNF